MICNCFRCDDFTVLQIYSILLYSIVKTLLSSPLQPQSDIKDKKVPDKKATLMTG